MLARLDDMDRDFLSEDFRVLVKCEARGTNDQRRTYILHNVLLAKVVNFLEGQGQPRSQKQIKRCTAAVSTPVGPPPQMTKLRSRFRSSGEQVGRAAASKLSKIQGHKCKNEYKKGIY
jgi:hypothetical protein